MTLLTQYSQIDTSAWERLLKESSVASWFQSNEAYCFLDNLSFMKAFVVAVVEDGTLMGLTVGYIQGDGGMLKKRLSRRAIIIGGPLLSKNITEHQLSAMLSAVRQLPAVKNCIYIETRNLNDFSRWKNVFEDCGFKYVPHYNFHQDTTSIAAINSKLSRTRKRHIHVGLRDGATLGEATTEAEVDEFYGILSDLYRHKVKKPLPPREFFQKMLALPSAKILTVNYQGHVIGGMAYIELSERVGYEWYVCGMDDKYKTLYPSELATYAGLQYAATSGCPRFDFMGAGKPDVSYGVRDFKALFGGELVEHGRYLHLNKTILYNLGKVAINILERLHRS